MAKLTNARRVFSNLNPISILNSCHRVLGAGGSLTGYAGGLEKKEALLKKYITIDNIKKLTIEEFKEVGINERLANDILIHLNN